MWRKYPLLWTIAILVVVMVIASAVVLRDLRQTREAFLYAYTPYMFEQTIRAVTTPTTEYPQAGFNTVLHADELADANDRTVTTPNVDTIYSIAAIDLSEGPVRIALPAPTERYYSLAFLDPFTDIVGYIDYRDVVTPGAELVLTGRDARPSGDVGTLDLHFDAARLLMISRVLVAEPADLPAAEAVQRQIAITSPTQRAENRGPLAASPPQPNARPSNASSFLTGSNTARNWLPDDHASFRRGLSYTKLGISREDSKLSAYDRFLWDLVLSRGPQALQAALNNQAGSSKGWQRAPAHLGAFGEDDATRAVVSLVGLGALQQEQAIYFSASNDAMGEPLSGDAQYKFIVEPEGLPAGAFWSLTVYEPDSDGRYFLYANPLGRHAIGDRTPGMIRSADDSLIINIGNVPGDQPANWLPAPAGPFQLTLRLYLPTDEALDPSWLPPELGRLPE